MKKIQLNTDDLQVASFDTGEAEPQSRGTVAAHQLTAPFTQQVNCTYDVRCQSHETCPEQYPYSTIHC